MSYGINKPLAIFYHKNTTVIKISLKSLIIVIMIIAFFIYKLLTPLVNQGSKPTCSREYRKADCSLKPEKSVNVGKNLSRKTLIK